MLVQLRPYQHDLVGGIRNAFRQVRRVLAVAATGAGKTIIFAFITNSVHQRGKRVMIVAHRQEIVDQISQALDGLGVRHGRIQPGHTMTDDLVQVAMVQTLSRRLDRMPQPDLLVVDEAHHAVAGTWKTVAEAWQTARILGVTATPQRLDGRGLGEAFDAMVMGPPMRDLITGGFLADYEYLAPPTVADLSEIGKRAGDYAIDELAQAMDKATVTGDACAHYTQYLAGRTAVAFCVTVAHAEHVAAQFRSAGYRAASVDGSMDKADRRNVIASLADGRLQVVTSCDIISEGFDLPSVQGAILLRPTFSLAMYLQQVGRVLRPKPDGSRAIILDHVGNIKHGLPDDDREWSLEGRKKKPRDAMPISTCKACFRVYPSGTQRQPCDNEPDCLFAAKAVQQREIEHREGELVALNVENMRRMAATPLSRLMDDVRTVEDLHAIRKAKKYHPRWVHHQMQFLAQKRASNG